MQSRGRGGRTRKNNTRTDDPSVPSLRRSELEEMTHQVRLSWTKYTRSAPGVSDKDCWSSERSAHLVRQREEVLVEPENVEADGDALDPIPLANDGTAVRPHHIREPQF